MDNLALATALNRDLSHCQGPMGEAVCILCILRSIEVELERESLRRASDSHTELNAITGQLRVTPSLLDATGRLWPEITPLSSGVVRPIPRNPRV
ncbi:hypothetical protein LCGC14_1945140 [marine sediment metagenome]|uniref:Uncharacterized protein n=1 Tax=marine sediment metagenome TaxID=412755 RepID=A0A0F9G7F1_9ZZZZ